MNLLIFITVSTLFFVLLAGLVVFFARKIRNKSISPKAATFFGFIGCILIFVLFVLLMGLLRYIHQ